MERHESCWVDQAESILDQLLKFTAQLSELENDPQVNARALSDACMKRLDDLKRLLPTDTGSSPASRGEVLEKMRNLYDRTQVCLEVLGRKNNRLAAELQNLTKTRQAISAYRKK
jgi:hypothetical protein